MENHLKFILHITFWLC